MSKRASILQSGSVIASSWYKFRLMQMNYFKCILAVWFNRTKFNVFSQCRKKEGLLSNLTLSHVGWNIACRNQYFFWTEGFLWVCGDRKPSSMNVKKQTNPVKLWRLFYKGWTITRKAHLLWKERVNSLSIYNQCICAPSPNIRCWNCWLLSWSDLITSPYKIYMSWKKYIKIPNN